MKELVDELAEPFMAIAISRSEVVNLDKVVSYNPCCTPLTVEGGYHLLGIAQRQYGCVIRALKVRNIATATIGNSKALHPSRGSALWWLMPVWARQKGRNPLAPSRELVVHLKVDHWLPEKARIPAFAQMELVVHLKSDH